MVFDAGTKAVVKWRKESLVNRWYWDNWTSTCKKLIQTQTFYSIKKINSKWITDLSIKCKGIKCFKEKKTEEKVFEI